MNPVLTKRDFVKRYQSGEFGNCSPTWTIPEWWVITREVSNGTLFHLRNKEVGGETFYNLDKHNLASKLRKLGKACWGRWYISEMAPTARTLIQGEVQRLPEGLYLRYNNRARLPMREALAQREDHAWGVHAMGLLQTYMCSGSYEWLNHLLDAYKDHVIEFSTYGINWGTVPGMNTVFWEVRKY